MIDATTCFLYVPLNDLFCLQFIHRDHKDKSQPYGYLLNDFISVLLFLTGTHIEDMDIDIQVHASLNDIFLQFDNHNSCKLI